MNAPVMLVLSDSVDGVECVGLHLGFGGPRVVTDVTEL